MFLKDLVIPNTIDNFIINKQVANKITKLLAPDFIENLFIYGPAGSGKYTLVMKALEKIVGKTINKTIKTVDIKNNWGTIREAKIPCSEFHFEINLSKYGLNKNNLFSIIEELCESREINQTLPFKIIVIRNLHQSSIEFVKFIKQKAEIYNKTTKFFIISQTHSKYIQLLKGLFFTLRIPSPNIEDIISVIKSHKMKVKKKDLTEIVISNKINLSRIMVQIEIVSLTTFYKTRNQIQTEKIIKLLKDKKLSTLGDIRTIIYEHQTNNEDLDLLINMVTDHFLDSNNKLFSTEKKMKLVSIICDYNILKTQSFKEIVHIEKFIFCLFRLVHS
jgi:hypothetical protein